MTSAMVPQKKNLHAKLEKRIKSDGVNKLLCMTQAIILFEGFLGS